MLPRPVVLAIVIFLFFTNHFLWTSITTIFVPKSPDVPTVPKQGTASKPDTSHCPEPKPFVKQPCPKQEDTSKTVFDKKRYRIALTFTATKHYARFIDRLIETGEKYFLPQHEIHYFVFTDKELSPKYAKHRRVHKIHFEWKPWPHSSAARFNANMDLFKNGHLKDFDYLYTLDADSKFVGLIGEEILGSWVGTLHCEQGNWYGTEVLGSNPDIRLKTPIKKPFHINHATYLNGVKDKAYYMNPPYEANPKSQAYVNAEDPEAKYYFYGGFYGGQVKTVEQRLAKLLEMKSTDLANGIQGVSHDDESYMNALNWKEPPEVVLGAGYMHPTDYTNHPWQWVGWDDWKNPPPPTARLISEPKILNMGYLEAHGLKHLNQ